MAYTVNGTLFDFNEEVKKLSYMLKNNHFPEGLINNVVNMYRDKGNASTVLPVDAMPPDSL